MQKKTTFHRFIELSIVFSLLGLLLGKAFFSGTPDSLILFGYGICVTVVIWAGFFVAFTIYKDPYEIAVEKNKRKTQKKKYFVSCMVAVRNEEKNISRCIESMIGQTYLHKEIIVVNDASTDGTLQILKEYEKRGEIILINLLENKGKKKALARAMAIAKGEIFAHTDSDSIWAPDAIEKITTIFVSDENVGAVSGHGRALNAEENLLTKIQDSWMEGQFSVRKAYESVFNAVTCVSGPLAVFRKSAIYNFIPAWENDSFLGQEFKFATDRTLTGFVLGNKAMGQKIKKKYAESEFVKNINYPVQDWKVVYCKSAHSWTIVPDTFSRFIHQQVRWKKSFIRNLFFTGLFYWKKPLPAAITYYFHILFVTVGPLISFRHLVYLPLKGNFFSGLLYLTGIAFVGFAFAFACKLEEKHTQRWIYRPLMGLFSTFIISWLIFYSAATIKKMIWYRN